MHTVIFTGGESPDFGSVHAYFSRRPPDYVIAADSGLETLARYQAIDRAFAPHVIVGDMDSLSDKTLLHRYPSAEVHAFPADKDWSDTELALKTAQKTPRPQQITLVGAGGGRADHFLAVFDLFSTPLRPDTWLTPVQALWYAGAGSCFEIAGIEPTAPLSVARTSRERTGGRITSEGFQWEAPLFRADGMPSLSNRISRAYAEAHEPIQLRVEEGDFVLILPLGAEVRRTKQGEESEASLRR